MADPQAAEERSNAKRFLTFRVGPQLYALSSEAIVEVIRAPSVARVPACPRGLMGVANLRGAVVPLASARGLLGLEDAAPDRAIVLSGQSTVALAVDRVDDLVSIDVDRIDTRPKALASEAGERLAGLFQDPRSGEAAKILDVWALIREAFVQPSREARRSSPTSAVPRAASGGPEPISRSERLITFDLAGQEFALPLACVEEVTRLPDEIVRAPRAEAVLLGVCAHRDQLLPMLSLRSLLGLSTAQGTRGSEKVLVTRVGDCLVGLVADGIRSVVAAEPELVESIPPMLAARTAGESRIRAIYRSKDGRRLVSILDPKQLFREDVMAKLGESTLDGAARSPAAIEAAPQCILVFRLGKDEFGLPIEVVEEVTRPPAQITRVPKTPKFLEGVINLRGEVLPVVDQRRRFDMGPSPSPEARKLVVVRTDRHRAGLIVDSVSEVLRTTSDSIEPAPHLTSETTRLVRGVLNLETAGRLILLLDPAELLTRTERGLLDAFQAAGGAKPT